MKRFISITFLFLLISPLFSQAIKIGYFQSPPYVFQDKGTGKIKGALYDFLEREIAPRMGVKFEWTEEPIPIIRQLKYLESGKLDASAMFGKNPERALLFAYPEKPYYRTHSGLCVLAGNQLTQVNTVDDILEMTVGYCGKAFTTPFMKDSRINWDFVCGSSCVEQTLKKLLSERVDCLYQPDELGILFYVKKYGVANQVRVIRLPEDVEVYMPFSKKAAVKYMDKYVRAMEDAGGTETLMKYMAEYIDESILKMK